jgi:hypothetical protein
VEGRPLARRAELESARGVGADGLVVVQPVRPEGHAEVERTDHGVRDRLARLVDDPTA